MGKKKQGEVPNIELSEKLQSMYGKHHVPGTKRNHVYKKVKKDAMRISLLENINRYQVNIFMTKKYNLWDYIFYQIKIICIFTRCNMQVNVILLKV